VPLVALDLFTIIYILAYIEGYMLKAKLQWNYSKPIKDQYNSKFVKGHLIWWPYGVTLELISERVTFKYLIIMIKFVRDLRRVGCFLELFRSPPFRYNWCIVGVINITWRVSHKLQALLILREHLFSPPVCWLGSCCSSF
jgi:hypothetical protein